MQMTFRWFGPDFDPIPLQYVRQIPGVTGIMGVFDQFAVGEVWDRDTIGETVKLCADNNLKMEVIESVNVHEDIKLGLPTRDRYIANYCETLENLAYHGVKTVIYNFMPVFDWLRTDLAFENPDGSTCLYYDHAELLNLTPQELVRRTAQASQKLTLPGWEPERLDQLDEVLEQYRNVTPDDLRANWEYFLKGVIPTCERVGIRLAVHPDDPAWPLFGLPRVYGSAADMRIIADLVDSPANGFCVCSGSLGSNPENDVPAIFAEFGRRGLVVAAHVRNVRYLGNKHFQEAQHLSSDGSLDIHAVMEAIHETCPDVWIRPDHGRMIWGESGRPGYPLYDRALGATYLMGLWEAIDKSKRR